MNKFFYEFFENPLIKNQVKSIFFYKLINSQYKYYCFQRIC